MATFPVCIVPEDDWLVARCAEVGVTSQGRTIAEAEENIREAIQLYIESSGLDDIPESPIKPLWTTVEL